MDLELKLDAHDCKKSCRDCLLESCQNFNLNLFLNFTGYDLIDKIWIPNLIFSNSLTCETIYIDQSSSLTIERKTDPYLPPIDGFKENYLYSGSENPLLYNDTYELTFHCDFDLIKYPFDTQHCFIKVWKLKQKLQNYNLLVIVSIDR